MSAPIDALIALSKARNSSDRAKVMKKHASVELKALLALALMEPPIWSSDFPTPPQLVQTRIFSDQNWYFAITEFASKATSRSLTFGDAVTHLERILAFATTSQRDWTKRILSGNLGFPLSKWDVQNAFGDLHSIP